MPADDGEVAVQTTLHPENRWIMVPVPVGEQVHMEMVLDTGAPLSAISVSARDLLLSHGHLEQVGPRRYILRGMQVGGYEAPELLVHLSGTVTRVGAQGVLGLNFLQHFREICFDVPLMRLRLRL